MTFPTNTALITSQTIGVLHAQVAARVAPLPLLPVVPRAPDARVIAGIHVLFVFGLWNRLPVIVLSYPHLWQSPHHISLSIVLHVPLRLHHAALRLLLLLQRHAVPLLQLLPPHLLQLPLPLFHLLPQQRYASHAPAARTCRRRLGLQVHVAALRGRLPREQLRLLEVLQLVRRAHEVVAHLLRPVRVLAQLLRVWRLQQRPADICALRRGGNETVIGGDVVEVLQVVGGVLANAHVTHRCLDALVVLHALLRAVHLVEINVDIIARVGAIA